MNLNAITVQNVLGAKAASITMTAGRVALICGHNGGGKSSVIEAARMACLAKSERMPTKKDMADILRDGSRAGIATVDTSEGVASLALPAGDIEAPGIFRDRGEALGFATGQDSPLALRPKDLRSSIARLLGGHSSADEVRTKLIESGHAETLVDAVAPLLRIGIDKAAAECAAQARSAKSAWQEVTGRGRWGANVAESWQPAGEPGSSTPEQAKELRGQITTLESRIAKCNREMGQAQTNATLDRESLQELAGRFAELEDKRSAVAQEIEAKQVIANGLSTTLSTTNGGGVQCPCCKEWIIDRAGNGEWEKFGALTDEQRAEAEGRLAQATAEITTLHAELKAAAALVRDADAAARKLDEIGKSQSRPVAEIQASLDELDELLQAARERVESESDGEQWHRRKDRAAELHAEIMGWIELQKSLEPGGLVDSLVNGPVESVNAQAAEICDAIGWRPVSIGPAGDVRFGSRPIRYCSESERWRADFALRAAIAHLAGVNFIFADRLDVIDPQTRGDVLFWALDHAGTMAAVFGCTMKARPSVPEGVQVLWMGLTDDEIAEAA